MAFKFEKLLVWQKAMEISYEIHELTRTFPKEELFILTSQIKRAADSISLNIAEGSTSQSNPEFKKFLGYSLRSGVEVVGCLYLGRKRKIIKEEDFKRLYSEIEEVLRMIQGLKKTLS